MGFIKYTVSITMIALFAIAILSFAFNFSSDNSAYVGLDNDAYFNSTKNDLEGNITVFYGGVNTSSDAFQKSTISSQTEASEGGTQFKVTPGTSLGFARTTVGAAWNKIFGADSSFGVVFTALVAILTFIMIMYAYKAWVGRNPD